MPVMTSSWIGADLGQDTFLHIQAYDHRLLHLTNSDNVFNTLSTGLRFEDIGRYT